MTKPKWTPIEIRLGDIIPYDGNPKFSTKAQALRLIESEKEFGQARPFNVSPYLDGGVKARCYDGHQRYGAWLTAYGEDFVVSAYQCNRHLSDDELKKFIITLDHTAKGSLDWNKLASWDAPKLQEWGMDETLKKEWDNDALNLREMIGAEEVIPTLDELREEYGETGERDFYPVIRVQVSPETFTKYNALMKEMAGVDDAEKFDALISRGC